ncbi:MAG: hypothetical protein KAV00_17315 [Phycisphaerae bacterium]|nr:hypothetical protein [Phycisphaerae bacterium]
MILAFSDDAAVMAFCIFTLAVVICVLIAPWLLDHPACRTRPPVDAEVRVALAKRKDEQTARNPVGRVPPAEQNSKGE